MGELILKDLPPQWLPGDGLYKGKTINSVTKEVKVLVRVVLSTNLLVVG